MSKGSTQRPTNKKRFDSNWDKIFKEKRSDTLPQNPRLIDLTGARFSRWIVLRRAENDKSGNRYWECVCDCGTTKKVSGVMLKNGHRWGDC